MLTSTLCIGLIASLALSGCAEREVGAAKLANYVERLSTAADIEIGIVEGGQNILQRVDLPSDLDTDSLTATGSLSLIDFLSLGGCELQVNIAKRNTSMGRTASSSQHLILDLEFLRLAPACVTLMEEKEEDSLANTLRKNIEFRRTNLPTRIFAATLGGPEWQKFWDQPMLLGSYPESASGDSAQALWELSERVQRFLDHSWSAADEDLEPLLSSIRANSGGQLLAAASLQSGYLEHANDVLRSASNEGIYCRNEAITEAGTITKTVVAKYFAADVQRWSAQVSQRHYEIQSALNALETHLTATLPQRYLDWVTERDALLHGLYAATREHVAVIKKTVNAC
tara:strand:+ start:370 stop:1395 length:1026 start_codon:yes stop_codon:yes gene_type:complete